MTLDKGIEHGKEHRKEYRRSKAFDRTCRNHGSCGRCEGNRTYANEKRLGDADRQIEEYAEQGGGVGPDVRPEENSEGT